MNISLADLDGTNGFRLDGVDALDRSGTSVASAGDVNGDGIDDLIIGASRGEPNNAGASYVVFGKVGGFAASLALGALDGTDGFRLDGVDEGDYSGVSVASAGDVNGDGIDDLIIGATGADQNGEDRVGESYVVFGTTGGFAATLSLGALDGTNGFRLDGVDPDDVSGISVASAGDVNGDGIDDLIIGASSADRGGQFYAGESYVVFGRAGGFAASLSLSALDGTNGFRLDGVSEYSFSGGSVASAGDVNGDGFDDLIIGADSPQGGPYFGGVYSAGDSYLVFGRAGGFAASLSLGALDGTNGVRIAGIDVDDRSGTSVASAGDVNGDGIDDLIIGANRADPGGRSSAGESYVVFGRTGGFAATLSLSTLNGTNGFRLDGVDAFDNSGRSVASAGDMNGDGVDDLIIGASDADPGGRTNAGESYVVFGKRGGFAASLSLSDLNGANGFRLDGVDEYDFSGSSVASAGDVNGDGVDDIIIGARFADPGGRSDAGESYVVFGVASPRSLVGTAGADTLVGLGGDDLLDGAGGDDLLRGGGGRDTLLGGDGGDTLDGGAGADRLRGGAGIDFVSYASAAGPVVADFGAGVFRDGEGGVDDVGGIDGAIGSAFGDRLVGGATTVTLLGGAGADRLVDGGGNDSLDGGVGDDTILALTGNNRVAGGAGADRITAGGGADTIAGGAERDVIRGGAGNDRIDGGAGDDDLDGGLGDDTILGGDGDDVIRTNAGADSVDGGLGDDTILGFRGAQVLRGGAGDDAVRGSVDGDTLEGGAGADRLQGDAGRDVFVFRAGFADDRVLDFTDGSDLLDFRGHTGVAALGDLSLRAVGTTVLVEDGSGGRLVLAATALADIDAGDFLF